MERLLQSNYILEESVYSMEDIKRRLMEKFEEIDFEQAKNGVELLVHDVGTIELWSVDFLNKL